MSRGNSIGSKELRAAKRLKIVREVKGLKVFKISKVAKIDSCAKKTRKAKKMKREGCFCYTCRAKGIKLKKVSCNCCIRGPRRCKKAKRVAGPTGPAGPAGATGPTGPTGPVVAANNLSATLLGDATLSQNDLIPWGTAMTSGTSITHAANSPTITLAPNQVYEVTYNLGLENDNNLNSDNLIAQLNLNGAMVPGSSSTTALLAATSTFGDTASISNSAIVRVGGQPGTLTVQYTSSASAIALASSSNIIVIKLE